MNGTQEWIKFADEDLTVAKAALEKEVYNQACFHAQQGVEKALKGFLRSRQRSVPKSHTLQELLAICQRLDESFERLRVTCIQLDRFYIPTRYPDALPGMLPEGLPARRDAEEAIELLQDALDWIKQKVGLKNP